MWISPPSTLRWHVLSIVTIGSWNIFILLQPPYQKSWNLRPPAEQRLLLPHQTEAHPVDQSPNLNINTRIGGNLGRGQETGQEQGIGQGHHQGQERRSGKSLIHHLVLILLLEGRCGLKVDKRAFRDTR